MNPQSPNPTGPYPQGGGMPAPPGGGMPTPPAGAPLQPHPMQSAQMQPAYNTPPAPPSMQPTMQPSVTAQVANGQPQPVPRSNPNSTQNTLQIAEIRDGIVIMHDGSFRSVVMVKSINFDLMSQQEQEAVEYSYQS
ncbi:MAG: hypothetical protein JWP13_13, partial [Candidatus Saccharibacteria bacterium]|nr:hypothetical protein [Candidatus Saccharibacteria bacterium]